MIKTYKTTIAVCVTEELNGLIRAEAAAQDRSISWVVEKLLRSALGCAQKPVAYVAGKAARGAQQHQQVLDADGHREPAHAAKHRERR